MKNIIIDVVSIILGLMIILPLSILIGLCAIIRAILVINRD